MKALFYFSDLVGRSILYQALIRKHSFKDYWYHSWLASTRQFETLGSMPQGGAGGQNLEHLIFAVVESFVFNLTTGSFSG